MSIKSCTIYLLVTCLVVGFSGMLSGQNRFLHDSPLDSSGIAVDRAVIGKFQSGIITTTNFNKGLIEDPLLLIQGRLAGVQIYNRGGDPNAEAIAIIRGVSSLDADISPLIVIDGIPNLSLDAVDPSDIESVRIIREGYGQGQYGFQGANGVIEIATKGLTLDSTLIVSMQSTIGMSSATRDVDVLDADEFVSRGGLDLESNQNYLNLIKRPGLSHAHGIVINKNFDDYGFRMSGNYRNTTGVLKESGFLKINGAGQFGLRLFGDKLKINLNGSITQNNQELSFREAFRYALTMNPTTPVFAKDAPFQFSQERYGGYFESVGLFATFNPVALLDLNTRGRSSITSLYSANVNFEIVEGVNIRTIYSRQSTSATFDEFGGAESLFLGIGSVNPSGFGKQVVDNGKFNFFGTELKYRNDHGISDWYASIGYDYQSFANDETSNSYRWPDITDRLEVESQASTRKLIAFYNRLNYNYDGRLELDLGLRFEGSSEVVGKNQWHLFPSARMKYQHNGLYLAGSFGQSGSRRDVDQILGSSEIPEIEKNIALDLSLGYSIGKVSAQIALYSKKTNNVNLAPLVGVDQLMVGMHTKGVELSVLADVVRTDNVVYRMNAHISTYSTKMSNLFTINYGSPGSPGFGSTSLLRLADGAPFGQIFAPVYSGIDADGLTIYKDVNGDGVISVFSPGDVDTDYTEVGKAFPDFEIGWQHHIKIGEYRLNVLLRGAFGHSLINLNRLFYENDVGPNSFYNKLNTSKAIEGLNEARYSSLFVEDASFVKIDNASLTRTFLLGSSRRSAELSLICQNLLTLSGYTGADPEPSIFDLDGGGYFVPGIDRRATYRPSRTISLAMKLNLN